MTKTELQTEIKKLTKRVGQAKASGAALEVLERVRLLRLARMEELAVNHDSWTLINGEGKTEFVDRATFEERTNAWLSRRRNDGPAAGPGSA